MKHFLFHYICAAVLITLALGQITRYDNFKIVQIKLETQEQYSSFFNLFPKDTIDIWSNDQRTTIGENMEIMLNPIQYQKLVSLKSSFPHIVINQNVQKLVQDEKAEIESELKNEKQLLDNLNKTLKGGLTQQHIDDFTYSDNYYTNYRDYDTIINYVRGLKERYKGMVDQFELGKTVENRTIWGFHIHSPGQFNPTKKGLWINSLQHAREWVSAPTSQYTVWQLLEQYQRNPRIKNLLDNINIHYVPVLNADGYIFSHQRTRMWRKNRRGGYGVDLNRNWKEGWGSGSSSNRNSEVYRGESPLSEPEDQAVNKYLTGPNGKTISFGIDFHAYSEVVLRPWGKTNTLAPDEVPLKAMGQIMVDAIKKGEGKEYNNWRAVQLGLGNGLDDEFYGTHKFKGGFTTELRPRSSFQGGFALPIAQILPCAKENFEGVLALMDFMIKQ